jgi:hypothetical protein
LLASYGLLSTTAQDRTSNDICNTSVVLIYRAISPPNYEPTTFSDADRYKAWHGAIRDEIQALCSYNTWFLVHFHPSMNVVGSHWVYMIKRHVDGSIERYKTRLVARGFT